MIDPKAAETRILEGLAAVLDSLCKACAASEGDTYRAIGATCREITDLKDVIEDVFEEVCRPLCPICGKPLDKDGDCVNQYCSYLTPALHRVAGAQVAKFINDAIEYAMNDSELATQLFDIRRQIARAEEGCND